METRYLCLWPVFLVVLVGFLSPIKSESSYRLFDNLMSVYNPDVRPALNASHTITVKLGIAPLQIREVNVEKGILDLVSWVTYEWDDPMLKWDPRSYGGQTSLSVPSDTIWRPDIIIANLVAAEIELNSQNRASLSHYGTVRLIRPLRTKTSCAFDPKAPRHDCRLKFLCWSYDGFKVDLVLKYEKVDMSSFVQNGKWKVVGTNSTRNNIHYACCVEPYPDVVFNISLQRRDSVQLGTLNSASIRFPSAMFLPLHFISAVCYIIIALCVSKF